MGPIQILGIALAASLAVNALQFRAYLGVRDERTEAIGARDQALGAAKTCSESVDRLQAAAVTMEAENGELRQAAAQARQGYERQAQQLLSLAPPVPGDDCRSAAAIYDGWLQGRAKR